MTGFIVSQIKMELPKPQTSEPLTTRPFSVNGSWLSHLMQTIKSILTSQISLSSVAFHSTVSIAILRSPSNQRVLIFSVVLSFSELQMLLSSVKQSSNYKVFMKTELLSYMMTSPMQETRLSESLVFSVFTETQLLTLGIVSLISIPLLQTSLLYKMHLDGQSATLSLFLHLAQLLPNGKLPPSAISMDKLLHFPRILKNGIMVLADLLSPKLSPISEVKVLNKHST